MKWSKLGNWLHWITWPKIIWPLIILIYLENRMDQTQYIGPMLTLVYEKLVVIVLLNGMIMNQSPLLTGMEMNPTVSTMTALISEQREPTTNNGLIWVVVRHIPLFVNSFPLAKTRYRLNRHYLTRVDANPDGGSMVDIVTKTLVSALILIRKARLYKFIFWSRICTKAILYV